MYDTVIKNGSVVTPNGIENVSIAIKDKKIVALLAQDEQQLTAELIIDATGLYVLPGAIDIHFHCRAPAYPDRGDFATETQAAAAGGVTTIFEMPISKPCCATGDIFRMRKALAAADSYVNYGLYAAPGLLDRDEIEDMVNEGAIGFKIFMTSAPAGRDDEFEGLCLPNVPDLYQALKLVAETGLVCALHAEYDPLIDWHTQQLKAAGRNDVPAHGESRPPHVEALAIAAVLTLNEKINANVHIAHLSGKEPLDVFRRFKATGSTATAETCPHYLFFTEQDIHRVGPYAKINPPLRKDEDVAAVWEGIRDGSLMAVTTDHSPFTAEEKERARTDIWLTPPGAPGVQELMLGMMDAALRGKLTIQQAVNLISTNGAKRFGVYPEKGAIMVNADADIVLYDPSVQTTISEDMLFSKSKASDKLYEGMVFQGGIVRTIVNGKTIFLNGQIVGERGDGAFVRPDPSRVDTTF
ncbi:MAG: dihydroorotase [Anaerolineaceae bacterium]|nr:MAG: dihydroorotase [Anaerolineaceae bacterium]